jgi:anti-anti-sigma factor
LVEQETLNLKVDGSSPSRPTWIQGEDLGVTDFGVSLREVDSVPYRVIAVSGELGLPDVDRLQVAFDDAAADGASVVVDLEACMFIDSMALAALLRAHNGFAAEGRRLVIAGPAAQVRRVLEVSGLVIDGLVFADVESALHAR